MTIPAQTITVLDPGLGRVAAAPDSPLYLGTTPGGSATALELLSFSRLNDVPSVLGYGDLAADVAKALSERGGPVLAMGADGSTAAVSSAVTQSGAGPEVSLSGTARARYTGRVEIMGGGALGTGTFRYTLDRHTVTSGSSAPTWSATRTIPAGGAFVAGVSGLTMTFAAGTYVLGETYDFDTTPAMPNATDLGAAATALLALTQTEFPLVVVSATHATATLGASIAAAMGGHAASLATGFRYSRAIVDVGSTDTSANVLAESWSDRRVCPCYGFALTSAVQPYEAHAVRKVGCYSDLAARAARVLVSTDLARYAEGALGGVQRIDFDGFDNETLDAVGISTLRTWPGIPGFYVANGRLKSPLGSDFTDLHFGRLMDLACRTVYRAQLPFMAEGFRTNADGSINVLDKADVEAAVFGALRDALLTPKNARGVSGHVSEVSYGVDPTHNLNTSGTLLVNVGVRPLGYAKFIDTQIGFALNV
jgi:hypothetical protein